MFFKAVATGSLFEVLVCINGMYVMTTQVSAFVPKLAYVQSHAFAHDVARTL